MHRVDQQGLDEANRRIAMAERTRGAAEQAREKADVHPQERQATTDALYTSTSWRSAAPLRYLKQLNTRLQPNVHATFLTGMKSLLRPLLARQISQLIRRLNRRNIRRALRYIRHGQFMALYQHISYAASRLDIVDTTIFLAIPRLMTSTEIRPLPVSTDVIIPVYNGMEFLKTLFDSILQNTNSPYRVIIIDDASSDQRIWPYLQNEVKKFPTATLIRNQKNCGFVVTCNRAIALTHGHFVICNTDIEVPPAWLERLMAPIYADTNVATVTPFTNAGTICSFPDIGGDNEILNGWSTKTIDRFFAQLADPSVIDMPTGVGFCMAFNRRAVQEVGVFDDQTFTSGYGEENDWCMRASERGYVHRMATNLFVYHKHGGSFTGKDRTQLRESNFRKLVARYPRYPIIIDSFMRRDPAKALRSFLLLYIVAHLAGRKTVLIVDHALGGGANLYRNQMIACYSIQEYPILLLTYEYHAKRMRLDFSFRKYETSFMLASLDDISHLSQLISIEEVFYNNAVSYSDPLAVAEALLLIKKRTRVKLTVSFHDYFPVCPSYTLINSEGQYCRLPVDLEVCNQCLARSKLELVRKPDKGISQWREVWGALVSVADIVLCFSEDTAKLVQRAYPFAETKIVIRPHQVDYLTPRRPQINLNNNLHIGVVGCINYAKGADIVCRIAQLITKRKLKMRITVVGTMSHEKILPSLRVTGPYRRENLSEILEREEINICFLPSICPETFSYVTEELMQLEVPLCCFDFGAPADRVSKYAVGRVLRSTDPEAALYEIFSFYEDLRCEHIRRCVDKIR
jgi:O-antigen biosynthesis protein